MKNDEIVHLLILHESFNEAERLISVLRNAGYPVRAKRIEDGEDLQDALEEQVWDLMFASPSVADYTAQQAVADLAKAEQDVPCVVVSDTPTDDEKIAQLLRSGVRDVAPASSETRVQLVAVRGRYVCSIALYESLVKREWLGTVYESWGRTAMPSCW